MPNSINKLIIENIYTNIVQTSRNKIFFLDFKVNDTVESRFDIIILHSFPQMNMMKHTKVGDYGSLSLLTIYSR